MLGVVERKRHVVLRRIGIVFAVLSGAFLAAAGVLAVVRVSRLASQSARADGVVVAIKHRGRGGAPVVEYRPAPGPPVRFEGTINSKPPAYEVGEHVAVRYDPAAPLDAIIDGFWEKWILPFIFATIGLPYVVLATIMLLLGARARAREQELRDNGTRVAGKIVAVEPTRAGKRRAHKLIVEARDPASGEPRRFPSNPVFMERPEEAVGQTVNVLVDAGSSSRFLVDLSS